LQSLLATVTLSTRKNAPVPVLVSDQSALFSISMAWFPGAMKMTPWLNAGSASAASARAVAGKNSSNRQAGNSEATSLVSPSGTSLS
jgi:hypothetical protein